MENYLDKLNDKQREAVTTIDGPLLVLAGAGSGKTTVLANRIAYILQNTYARPWNILAITFTNKAANEMKERIERLIGPGAKEMWIGTFHSICVKILRTCIDRIGYGSDFVIYDSADSRTLMKECLRELDIDEKVFPVRGVLSIISKAKNNLIDPERYEQMRGKDMRSEVVSRLYTLYQKKLKSNNALDFDDIIRFTVDILSENEDVADKYQARFQYILVDEYQDTNNTQYALINLLAQGYGNICVVGDDDQSIYKFRGANVNNILDFEKDYKDSKKIMLEQNYRSTSNILNAANAVIAHNSKRLGKKLWTAQEGGEPIISYEGDSDRAEARFIAREARRRYNRTGRWSDCAVLYRTNAQSRAIEDAFMKEAIPYKVLAGLRFYDRKEIKDVIAYLRLIYNYNDDVSFQRIINEPKRKIGTATLDKIRKHSSEDELSNFDVICRLDLYSDLRSAAPRLNAFAEQIKELRKLAGILDIESFVQRVITDSGYMAMLEAENTVESNTRKENINEFLNVVREFKNDGETSGTLGEFLESVTLVSDIDDYDQSQDCVVMMTIHSAKGLEFPVVFLAGLEEGLFPGNRSVETDEDIEEERRLCYVAITRAKEQLYVTRASSRFRYGKICPALPSRFFKEIPVDQLKDASSPAVKAKNMMRRAGVEIIPERRTMPVYERKKPVSAMDVPEFRKGDRVRHRKFGEGTIVSAQQFGKDAILLIDFDNVGAKRLMAAFAKLEKI